jgi:RNA polymerase sigma factor (sigma-70 family)
MTIHHLRKALQHLHRVLDPSSESSLTDGQLLARFVATRDEAAFAALMQRHGPMVFGVCRRILRHTQDTEDAFQATFPVLARKAGSVANRRALGSWLYRVAYRIAIDARARNDKRRAREKQVEELPHPQVLPEETRDWRTWLDHELNLLPERYRAVLVACDLEERPRKEAARLLGLAEGTVSSRLARGRHLLAKRLSRYGLSLSGGTLAAALSQEASAAVSFSLTSATMLAASGKGVVSTSVGFLTKGALKAMLLTKLKWTVGAAMVAVAVGATGLAYRASGQPAPAPAEKEVAGRQPTELKILRREVELIKLKLEVVQEKQRAQEAELQSLRAAAGEAAKRGGRESERDRAATPRPDAEGRARPEVDHFIISFLKGGGQLGWPQSFQRGDFEEACERLNALMRVAHKSIMSGSNPSDAILNDLLTDLRKLQERVHANVNRFSPDEYLEADRYLHLVKDTITALKDPNVVKNAEKAAFKEEVAKARAAALQNEIKRLRERVAWSERISSEELLRLQEAETALRALRVARDPDGKQRAADELEKALKKLREQMDKQEGRTKVPR